MKITVIKKSSVRPKPFASCPIIVECMPEPAQK